jgi:hypothetical protein
MRNHDALDAVQARRDQIARELEELQSEDAQLAIAEQALARLYGDTSSSSARARAYPAPTQFPQTQREVVLQTLRDTPTPWVQSRDIVESAKLRWGIEVPEKSLRPLLSVMKSQGEIVRRRRLIALPERAAEPQRAPSARRVSAE